MERLRVTIRGAVQGVGFRPFIYRLATELDLTGWVRNSSQGVLIEAEGALGRLETFLLQIEKGKPERAFIQSLEASFLDGIGYCSFRILESDSSGNLEALVLPDIATCPECLQDISDPRNRRYGYAFTNCTHCGPRFSMIEALPYDRANTSMNKFKMCPACRDEYENPSDRRFHAEPNACPECGPYLELWDAHGKVLSSERPRQSAWRFRMDAGAVSAVKMSDRCEPPLQQTARAIREGKIVAVKGLGGFHLMADARNDRAVERLRERKHRGGKPFALMYPSFSMVKEDCMVSSLEERLLRSPEAPIVLLRRKFSWDLNPAQEMPSRISPAVAPRNPYLGVMLPYTPLHYLLLRELNFPVVATSGNLAEEPMAIDEKEALSRLGAIADLFLVHNRPIVRHVDDSIVRVVSGREFILRRARGFAPLPIRLGENSHSVLAVGAHLKNTVAYSKQGQVFVSQHIGDLENPETFGAFQRALQSFQQFYHTRPDRIACDAHPGYLSTQYAEHSGLPILRVQHHHAHVLSCMAENEITGPLLGIAWDGAGWGGDDTGWGGEFFGVESENHVTRVAHVTIVLLPGQGKA
ncbi:MAG: carbamoyltransferase HypF, partial [Candidatus Omnitrophica bacterium]|nr:carbamoyltransferase HypF [Candidatus Omnitrophota bacterium]